jgi:hypothetical protein
MMARHIAGKIAGAHRFRFMPEQLRYPTPIRARVPFRWRTLRRNYARAAMGVIRRPGTQSTRGLTRARESDFGGRRRSLHPSAGSGPPRRARDSMRKLVSMAVCRTIRSRLIGCFAAAVDRTCKPRMRSEVQHRGSRISGVRYAMARAQQRLAEASGADLATARRCVSRR